MKRRNKTVLVASIITMLFLMALTGCSSPEIMPEEESSLNIIEESTDNAVVESEELLHPLVQFSHNGGFYEEEFDLVLSGEGGREIYYTTDGSDPRVSNTAVRYVDKIRIYDNTNQPNVYSRITDITLNEYHPPEYNVDKGIVIRAAFKNAAGEYSEVAENSYFIGKQEDYYSDLRVISLATDSSYLFDPDNGAYMVGSSYYEWLESDEYVEYDPGDVLNPTNYNRDGRESEFPVSIQVFEGGEAVYTDHVGARISGNWSRSGAQKSIRFYARKEYGNSKMKYAFFQDLVNSEGEPIEKFDKVTLRNGGNDHILHFRDAFIQELAKDLAVDFMASEPYILFINGEFWGFYLLREKPEDYYIQSHYGIDEKNAAVIKNGVLDSGTDDDLEEYIRFTRWAMNADMSEDDNYRKFCEQMDVQSFMDYIAVETYVNNNDWSNGYTNNWMVWRSKEVDETLPKADGKWRFILYDLDLSSGLYGSTETAYYYDSLNNNHVEWDEYNLMGILKNLCRNEEFSRRFYDNYIRIVDTCFDFQRVNALLDTYTGTYGEVTKATLKRFGNDWAASSYESEAAGLKLFFRKRPEYAKNQLDIYFGIAEETLGEVPTFSNNLVGNMAEFFYYGNAVFVADYMENALYAAVPEKQKNSWEIQCGYSNLSLKQGQKYRVTFEASCEGTGNMELLVNRFDGENYPTEWISEVVLSKDRKTYEYEFELNLETNTDYSLCFSIGRGKGDYVLQNVRLEAIE